MSRPKKIRPQIQEKIVDKAPEATTEAVKDNLISIEEVNVGPFLYRLARKFSKMDAS